MKPGRPIRSRHPFPTSVGRVVSLISSGRRWAIPLTITNHFSVAAQCYYLVRQPSITARQSTTRMVSSPTSGAQSRPIRIELRGYATGRSTRSTWKPVTVGSAVRDERPVSLSACEPIRVTTIPRSLLGGAGGVRNGSGVIGAGASGMGSMIPVTNTSARDGPTAAEWVCIHNRGFARSRMASSDWLTDFAKWTSSAVLGKGLSSHPFGASLSARSFSIRPTRIPPVGIALFIMKRCHAQAKSAPFAPNTASDRIYESFWPAQKANIAYLAGKSFRGSDRVRWDDRGRPVRTRFESVSGCRRIARSRLRSKRRSVRTAASWLPNDARGARALAARYGSQQIWQSFGLAKVVCETVFSPVPITLRFFAKSAFFAKPRTPLRITATLAVVGL